MKKMILTSIFLLGIAGFASAQPTPGNKNYNGNHIPISSHKAKKPLSKKSGQSKAAQSDNTKEYMKDGQLATPTGHQATPVNSDEYQNPRDSSGKKKRKQ